MKYVIAVSGGVDSMVLLDMLVHNHCKSLRVKPEDLIVAHFDHGIRDDSLTDQKFVRGVVGEYGLIYETKRAELGVNVSEEKAREARYNFLRQCCKKYNATLITAHHQDDLVETIIINLIRGTGWRGLVSLNSNTVIRPLLTTFKHELLTYAKGHSIVWKEDSTNANEEYLRNYIRLHLIPAMIKKDPASINAFILINTNTQIVKNKIATELQKLISFNNDQDPLSRYQFIMWPPSVAAEVIYATLIQLDPSWHPSSLQISRVLHFIKSGKPIKQLEVSSRLKIELTVNTVQFKKS